MGVGTGEPDVPTLGQQRSSQPLPPLYLLHLVDQHDTGWLVAQPVVQRLGRSELGVRHAFHVKDVNTIGRRTVLNVPGRDLAKQDAFSRAAQPDQHLDDGLPEPQFSKGKVIGAKDVQENSFEYTRNRNLFRLSLQVYLK